MRYLRLFEDFESQNIKSLIDDIKDMCVELNDIYMKTEINHYPPLLQLNGKIQREYLSISMEPSMDSGFSISFDQIEDTVYRIFDYMDSAGWKPSYIMFDHESYHVEFEDLEKWMSIYLKPEYWVYQLKIDFIRK